MSPTSPFCWESWAITCFSDELTQGPGRSCSGGESLENVWCPQVVKGEMGPGRLGGPGQGRWAFAAAWLPRQLHPHLRVLQGPWGFGGAAAGGLGHEE